MKNLLDLYTTYKEDNSLSTFTHLHFYPLKTVGNSGNGIANHKWIKIVGFNASTMTFTIIRSGGCDDLRIEPQKTGSTILGEMYKRGKLDITQMGFWHDGSFFIKGNFDIAYNGQTTNITSNN